MQPGCSPFPHTPPPSRHLLLPTTPPSSPAPHPPAQPAKTPFSTHRPPPGQLVPLPTAHHRQSRPGGLGAWRGGGGAVLKGAPSLLSGASPSCSDKGRRGHDAPRSPLPRGRRLTTGPRRSRLVPQFPPFESREARSGRDANLCPRRELGYGALPRVPAPTASPAMGQQLNGAGPEREAPPHLEQGPSPRRPQLPGAPQPAGLSTPSARPGGGEVLAPRERQGLARGRSPREIHAPPPETAMETGPAPGWGLPPVPSAPGRGHRDPPAARAHLARLGSVLLRTPGARGGLIGSQGPPPSARLRPPP